MLDALAGVSAAVCERPFCTSPRFALVFFGQKMVTLRRVNSPRASTPFRSRKAQLPRSGAQWPSPKRWSARGCGNRAPVLKALLCVSRDDKRAVVRDVAHMSSRSEDARGTHSREDARAQRRPRSASRDLLCTSCPRELRKSAALVQTHVRPRARRRSRAFKNQRSSWFVVE